MEKVLLRNLPVLVIGAGPVGMTIARALRDNGVPLLAVTSRSRDKSEKIGGEFKLPPCSDYLSLVPKARLILIAVRDDAVEEVSRRLHRSHKLRPGTFLAHFSGALTSDILRTKGAHQVRDPRMGTKTFSFSFHPLQAFASGGNYENLRGIPMIFEGDKEAIRIAKDLTRLLRGKFVPIPKTKKVFHHLAAVFLSNFLVTLAALSANINVKAGISPKESLSVLFPLLDGTVRNLKSLGIPKALTGPVQRGDFLTIQKHLKALRSMSGEAAKIYKVLSLEILKIARAKGLPASKTQEIERLLKDSA